MQSHPPSDSFRDHRRLVLMRHLPTAWNERRLYQGRQDIPLVARSRERAETLKAGLVHLAPEIGGSLSTMAIYSSPLSRAVVTAQLLFGRMPQIDERLIEIAYGDFEGRPLGLMDGLADPARGEPGWRGLDQKAPGGGESMREAMQRLQNWVSERAQSPESTIAVTHKGILAAAFALATGWDGFTKPRPRFRAECLQIFQVGPEGQLRLEHANIALVPAMA